MNIEFDEDYSGLFELAEQLEEAEQTEVAYGIVDSNGNPDMTAHWTGAGSVHSIGLTNHNGDPDNVLVTPNGVSPAPIPARPFLATEYEESSNKWLRFLLDKVALPILRDNNDRFQQNIRKLADITGNDVRKSIAQWEVPGNAPITILGKGFDDPLVERGQLRDSAKGVVVKK